VNIAFFGSSLVSAHRNSAATYYRGIVKALAARGHRITFYEPDAYERQQHRDLEDPAWAEVVVYAASEAAADACVRDARKADLVIKASGVGVFDGFLEAAVLELKSGNRLVAFWDVDAAATLLRLGANPNDPFAPLIRRYDLILTYGGGVPVARAYEALGAKVCAPIYNALDPETHHPSTSDVRFHGHLGFLGNRLPDREARVDEFFVKAAMQLPHHTFVLGGNGWHDKTLPTNVRALGHVFTRDHNAFNCSAMAVLNINRASTSTNGYSPATRVFEAAGAAACLITDAFVGIEEFLEPEREVLIAHTGDDVASHIDRLTPELRVRIGDSARRRVLAEHTYAHRVSELERVLDGVRPRGRAGAGSTESRP
jgi:spore maturation protein CgeB